MNCSHESFIQETFKYLQFMCSKHCKNIVNQLYLNKVKNNELMKLKINKVKRNLEGTVLEYGWGKTGGWDI